MSTHTIWREKCPPPDGYICGAIGCQICYDIIVHSDGPTDEEYGEWLSGELEKDILTRAATLACEAVVTDKSQDFITQLLHGGVVEHVTTQAARRQ